MRYMKNFTGGGFILKQNRADILTEELKRLNVLVYMLGEVFADVKDLSEALLELGKVMEDQLNASQKLNEIYEELNGLYESNPEYVDFASRDELEEDEYFAED